jgi:hypothetical protein
MMAAQGLALDGEIILRGDFLGRGQVEARLRFVGVGDGRGADLEIALGRFQLFGDRQLSAPWPWPALSCASSTSK